MENSLVSSEVFFGMPLFLLMLSEIRLAKGLGQQGYLQRDVGIPPQAVSEVALSLRGLAFFLRTFVTQSSSLCVQRISVMF